MDELNKKGIIAYVGKVTMDRNAPGYLLEKTDTLYEKTRNFLVRTANKYEYVKPIITPRFIPSCKDKTLDNLSKLAREFSLPVQSHLNENIREIEFVNNLCPDAKSYTDAYIKHGLFGDDVKTVMAHCVHNTEEEIKLLKEKGVFVAHCAQSNTNICSGIAPVSKYLSMDINMGLGTDVSGGANIEMECAIKDTIHASNLR